MSIQWGLSGRGGGGNSLVSEITTGMNSLTNGSGVASSTVSNDASDELDRFADAELYVPSFGTAPTADLAINLYIRRALDGGTNFEDASGSRPPRNGFVGSFPLANVTTAQRIALPGIILPPGDFQWYLVNNSGQTMASSGNILQVRYYTEVP